MTITAPPVAAAPVPGPIRTYEAQRGYADQAAWLRGKSIPEAEQALTARLATQDGSDYNAGATAATREFISASRALIDDMRRATQPAPSGEITIAPGDDTACSACLCPLPAGAPAWPDGDGGFYCADDVPEISEGE